MSGCGWWKWNHDRVIVVKRQGLEQNDRVKYGQRHSKVLNEKRFGPNDGGRRSTKREKNTKFDVNLR